MAVVGIIVVILMLAMNSVAENTQEKEIYYSQSQLYLYPVKSPLPFTLSLREYLERKSVELGVNPNLAVRIIECESGFKPTAQNKISSAYGIFQFLDSSWERVQKDIGGNLDRHDPYDQIDAGLFWLSTVGTSPWDASYSCWKMYQ